MFGAPHSYNGKIYVDLVQPQELTCTGRVTTDYHLGEWHHGSNVAGIKIDAVTAWRITKLGNMAAELLECEAESFDEIPLRIFQATRHLFPYPCHQGVKANMLFKGFFIDKHAKMVPRLELISAESAVKCKFVHRPLLPGQRSLLDYVK